MSTLRVQEVLRILEGLKLISKICVNKNPESKGSYKWSGLTQAEKALTQSLQKAEVQKKLNTHENFVVSVLKVMKRESEIEVEDLLKNLFGNNEKVFISRRIKFYCVLKVLQTLGVVRVLKKTKSQREVVWQGLPEMFEVIMAIVQEKEGRFRVRNRVESGETFLMEASLSESMEFEETELGRNLIEFEEVELGGKGMPDWCYLM